MKYRLELPYWIKWVMCKVIGLHNGEKVNNGNRCEVCGYCWHDAVDENKTVLLQGDKE
jgi:hypothetical protein